MCVTIQRGKNFKKLKMHFFLRLRNPEFRNYVLKKLFQQVTYSQRDKLLSSKLSLPTICESLTLQQAEMRIIREGGEIFNFSQEEEVLFLADPTALTNNATNQIKSTSSTAISTKQTRRQQASNQGSFQLKVRLDFLSSCLTVLH